MRQALLIFDGLCKTEEVNVIGSMDEITTKAKEALKNRNCKAVKLWRVGVGIWKFNQDTEWWDLCANVATR